jgi:hypothetical protein
MGSRFQQLRGDDMNGLASGGRSWPSGLEWKYRWHLAADDLKPPRMRNLTRSDLAA